MASFLWVIPTFHTSLTSRIPQTYENLHRLHLCLSFTFYTSWTNLLLSISNHVFPFLVFLIKFLPIAVKSIFPPLTIHHYPCFVETGLEGSKRQELSTMENKLTNILIKTPPNMGITLSNTWKAKFAHYGEAGQGPINSSDYNTSCSRAQRTGWRLQYGGRWSPSLYVTSVLPAGSPTLNTNDKHRAPPSWLLY